MLNQIDNKKSFKKPLSIDDIALDVKKKRLYWINNKDVNRVCSSNYEGTDVKVHVQDFNFGLKKHETFGSIALIDNYIYYWKNNEKEVLKIAFYELS